MAGDVRSSHAVFLTRAPTAEAAERAELEVSVAGSKRVLGAQEARRGDGHSLQWRVELAPEAPVQARLRGAGASRGDGPQVSLRTPQASSATVHKAVRFGWSGDIVGQGFGIDPERGGLFAFESVRKEDFDFFVLSGDTVYADQPLRARLPLPDGTTWNNLVTDEKARVAETLPAFLGQYDYNWVDGHYRNLWATTPVVAQWDDHEVLNNWYPAEILKDPRYQTRAVHHLQEVGWRALRASLPIDAPMDRLDRHLAYGPLLDVFVLDARSFRGPNLLQNERSPMLGAEQVDRLVGLSGTLRKSKGLWKVIACDMPLGLLVGDGPGAVEGFADGRSGPPRFRERELEVVLRHLPENVVFLTADVHYAAAHHYDPARSALSKGAFSPFWEFVAGPLHAGQFGPAVLDSTFGPRVVYANRQKGDPQNVPPSVHSVSYGSVEISPDGRLDVRLVNGAGEVLHRETLEPA